MATNSRSTATRKTQPAHPQRESTTADADEFDDEETTAAEAQEIEADGRHYVTARLVDEEIRVVPPGAWRQSWQTMLASGQFNGFAERVVHPDDLDLYFDIDPTNDEFEDFVSEAAKRSGESLGKSRGPGRSSRSTRRR